MSDYIVDTNIWVMVDKPIAEAKTTAELDCIEACLDWLKTFAAGQDRLVVDDNHRILSEYYDNTLAGGEGIERLNQFNDKPFNRIVFVHIEYDGEYAKLPDAVHALRTGAFKIKDRRFIAVALAHEPHPPIINATDSDWSQARTQLENLGIVIQEICPDFVQETLQGHA